MKKPYEDKSKQPLALPEGLSVQKNKWRRQHPFSVSIEKQIDESLEKAKEKAKKPEKSAKNKAKKAKHKELQRRKNAIICELRRRERADEVALNNDILKEIVIKKEVDNYNF